MSSDALKNDDDVPAGRYVALEDLPPILTVQEAADILRLDPRTIRDMVRTGELEGNQHRHCIRVMRASVVDWARGKRAVSVSGRNP